jgi:hypothetical protein
MLSRESPIVHTRGIVSGELQRLRKRLWVRSADGPLSSNASGIATGRARGSVARRRGLDKQIGAAPARGQWARHP